MLLLIYTKKWGNGIVDIGICLLDGMDGMDTPRTRISNER